MRRRSAALEPGALPPHLQKLQEERIAQIAAAEAEAEAEAKNVKDENVASTGAVGSARPQDSSCQTL